MIVAILISLAILYVGLFSLLASLDQEMDSLHREATTLTEVISRLEEGDITLNEAFDSLSAIHNKEK